MIAVVDPIEPVASPVLQPAVRTGRTKAELLATVSASRLSTFLGCRLKFFFRYVLKLQKPKTPSLHLGSAVHDLIPAHAVGQHRT